MTDKGEIQKWSREELEKRFLEMDSCIDGLEKRFDELEKINDNHRKMADRYLIEKQRSMELESAILTLATLLAEIRSHI